MKKLNFLRVGAFILLFFSFVLTNCTKTELNHDTTSLQQLSSDETNVQEAANDGINDANNVISPGTTKSRWMPCNATVDTIISGDTVIYTITYHGNNVWGKLSRSGQIIIKKSLTTTWATPHARVFVTFNNYKVTRL